MHPNEEQDDPVIGAFGVGEQGAPRSDSSATAFTVRADPVSDSSATATATFSSVTSRSEA
ncbi:MAG: hypothetical protein ACYDDU_22425 [Dermatophilaceae bacterium]